MKKILALLYNPTDTCSYYRAGGVFPDLTRRMDIDIRVGVWDNIFLDWQNILEYDLIFMQRPFDNRAVTIASYSKNLGIPVWVDYDDELLSVPCENPHAEKYGPESRSNIKHLLNMADAVSVTTGALKRYYEQFVNNGFIEVIPNAFNDYIYRQRPILRKREQRIIWRGGRSHEYDVYTVGDQINRAMQDFPAWEFYFMGFLPWYLDGRKNLFHIKETDILFYFNKLLERASTLMITPLNDSLFNRCKSNIAFIEAAFTGSVCLCPEWEEWINPGAINYTTPESFYKGIKEAIENPEETEKKAKRAWEFVTDQLLLSEINILRQELINKVLC